MSIVKQLLQKWFGLSDEPCASCEVLRESLHRSEAERRELLHRLLDKDKPEPPVAEVEEPRSIQPAFVPWRVRQQMLEQEDHKKAEILKRRTEEINELEKELGVNANQVG